MKRLRTTELPAHVGERIRVEGWLHAVRRLGGVTFLVIRDGWGLLQAVTEQEEEIGPVLAGEVGIESIIALEGLVVCEPQAPGGFELHKLRLEILSAIREMPPVSLSKRKLKAHMNTLIDTAVVTNRHPLRRAVLRLAAGCMAGFRLSLQNQGFTEVQTPKIVASATESGANVFKLDYFGRAAYLAQSPQFYKQILVGVFERVFEVGPVFRAEPHNTTRHINEYVSLDAEMGFIQDHFTVMEVVRTVLSDIFAHLSAHYAAELELLQVSMPNVPEEIPAIHFAEAQELIFQRHGVDERSESDLSPQGERWLGEWALEERKSDFLFVIGYPMRKRPFYTHPDPTRPDYSNSFDLLFRGTELITGGQRLHRYEDYLSALEKANLPLEPFADYLEAFRFGMPPHGGFAIGSERLVMQLLEAPNIRLTTTFPRTFTRLTP